MIRSFYKTLFLATAIFVASCGGAEKTEEIITEDEKPIPSIEESKFNAQNVFNTLPDRKMVMKLIGKLSSHRRTKISRTPTSSATQRL